jgi:release factor family 12
MINKGAGKKLMVLLADNLQAYADLCYQVVNGRLLNASGAASKSEKLDYIQLQADFLAEHYEQKLFDHLVIAAPQDVLKGLRDALPEQVQQLIVGELAEDLTINSNDVIENRLGDLIIEGRQQ